MNKPSPGGRGLAPPKKLNRRMDGQMAIQKVLNFGSLNLDYVYQVDHFVQAGETLSALSQTVKAGGKGLNQSIALSRAGAEVYHAGCAGRGGDMLRAMLKENGVHDEYLETVEALQGNAMIQVDPTGENCILLFGGSNQCITKEQIDHTLSGFSKGDWLVLQNEVNLVDLMVEQAFQKGMKIVLNPSPFNEKLRNVDFDRLTWILINEVEAEQLSGYKDPEKAWTAIHERYPQLSVLITLGSAGSIAWSVQGEHIEKVRQDAYPTAAVDTTAAGDTFTGYFVSGLMEGKTLKDSMDQASRASAIAVTRLGAAESIPFRNQLDDGLK